MTKKEAVLKPTEAQTGAEGEANVKNEAVKNNLKKSLNREK